MNAAYAAWVLLAWWLIAYAVHTGVADVAEGAQCCGRSWCDCEAADA